MNPNLQLKPDRLVHLLKAEILAGKRNKVAAAGGFIGIMLLIAFMNLDGVATSKYFLHDFFPLMLFTVGGIVTSVCFSNLNNKASAASFLCLPASHLEKLCSKWIQTLLLFPVILTLGYWTMSIFIAGVFGSFFGIDVEPLTLLGRVGPGSSTLWDLFKVYLLGHSVMFLGAVTFQRYEIFKTSLACMVAGTLFGLCAFLVFRVVFASLFNGAGMEIVHDLRVSDGVLSSDRIRDLVMSFNFWILPWFFYVVSYFKLTEKEA